MLTHKERFCTVPILQRTHHNSNSKVIYSERLNNTNINDVRLDAYRLN